MDGERIAGKRVLITGGAGFIGSHLAAALTHRNDVTVLDRFSTGTLANVPTGARVVEGDIRDPAAVRDAARDADLVYHQAAVSSVPRTVDRPAETTRTNVDGTLNVLEAARREDARFVLASSAAVYGDPDTLPIPETHPTNPSSPYGIQKLAADLYTRRYHDLYGLDTVALRYFNVYGPGQTGAYAGVITALLDRAADDRDLTVHGDGEQTRDFVHVTDVVRANLAAATTRNVGEAYNVATGDSVTIKELAEAIRDVTGTDGDVVHTEPRDGDVRSSRADTEKARDLLGFEAEVELRRGLRDLVRGAPHAL